MKRRVNPKAPHFEPDMEDFATRCEIALMGMAVEIHSDDEAREAFKYIKSACGYRDSYNDVDIISRINPRPKKTERFNVKYVLTYTLWGMPCICFCLSHTENGKEHELPFTEDYGTGCPCAFSYVFNLAGDDTCSEFGDVFFRKTEMGYMLAH